MQGSRKNVRRRRGVRLTPEERSLRRAEEMLRGAETRARRTAATVAYWQAKVQRLRAGNTQRIQPSLFGDTPPELPDELLTEQDSREMNVPTKQPLFGTESSLAGSPIHPHQHGTWPDSE